MSYTPVGRQYEGQSQVLLRLACVCTIIITGTKGLKGPLVHKAKKSQQCGMEQLVAQQFHNLQVAGSNPAPATKNKSKSRMAAKDYDKILVECCACCLSLDNPERMEIDGDKFSVCPYCGSTETKHMTIQEWNDRFERKYNLGPYLKLPRGMKWADIISHENKETMEEEQIRREIRNAKKTHKK